MSLFRGAKEALGPTEILSDGATAGLILNGHDAAQTTSLLKAKDVAGYTVATINPYASIAVADAGQTAILGADVKSYAVITGNQVAVFGRSNNKVNSMTGAIMGGYFQAANYNASAAGTIRGAYVEALLSGVNIGVARGLEVNVDSDDAETIATEISGAFVQLQTGSTQTFSGTSQVLRLAHKGIAGNGKSPTAFIRMDTEGTSVGAKMLIDASAAAPVACTGNIVCLMSFKASDGTVTYLLHDNDTATAVYCATSLPS